MKIDSSSSNKILEKIYILKRKRSLIKKKNSKRSELI